MSELSPQGRALLRATRAALRPQSADRERVLAGLREQIGAPPSGVAANVAATAHASRALWAVSAVALISVGVVVAMSHAPGPTRVKAPPVAASTPQPVAPAAEAAAPIAALEAAPAPSPAVAPSVLTRRDRLAEEVAILSQAAKDLRAGRAANALSALNEHQRKFPNGLLTQERRAARAEALCSLGRVSEAQSDLSILSRTAPQSPLTVRAQERCKAR